ncbi:Pentatricopeptide repeat-containing protein mitochondrial [Zea mays]|uniref:Pentatricopeptide repeat-containing protein mitochondrial n=1 Tax=Zea mays TaxID=4577 RepID=A0A1D6G1K6_MAIZE|nr:Pentatricopeptide repeat-containing protein mitochondrial [Zea mays]
MPRVVWFKKCNANGNGNGLRSITGATPRRDRRRHRPLLAPFDLSRLRATLSSHPLTPRLLARLLALSLAPATSLLLLDWYALSHPALSLSSLPLRPILAAADPDHALALLDSLSASRLPSLRESLLLPLLRSLPPGRALHLLDQMPCRFAVAPSFCSYNVILSTLARADCHADALLLYRRMLRDRVPPTTFTFSVAAHGRVAEAAMLLDEMLLMGCAADVNTFNDLVLGLCGLGRVREAARLVDRMMTRGCMPSAVTYGFLLQGLCRTRQADEACALLERLPEVNVVMLNTVIRGCLTEGKLARATELYEMMGSKGCPPDVHTYNILMHGLCKLGRFGSAVRMLDKMEENGCAPNIVTYSTLLHSFCRNGMWDDARTMLDQMLAKGFSMNSQGYNGIIYALCKDGKLDQATRLVQEMKSQGASRIFARTIQ